MAGTITLTLNDTVGTSVTLPIYNKQVIWNVSGLAAGKYTVTATYSGNDKYDGTGSWTDTFEVIKATPVISVDEVTVDAISHAVVVVHINDTATGTISIIVNNNPYAAVAVDKGVKIHILV